MTTSTNTRRRINVTLSVYEGDDFPEAAGFPEYVAERIAAGWPGSEVEISEVPDGQETRVFVYGGPGDADDVAAEITDMAKVDWWNDFCDDGYKVRTEPEDDADADEEDKIEQPAVPPCKPPGRLAGAHDWQRPVALVGGLKSNPGTFGSGHGSVKVRECCARCGIYWDVDYGASRPDNGEKYEAHSYMPADEASKAWAQGIRDAADA